jgi:hypothetical protein
VFENRVCSSFVPEHLWGNVLTIKCAILVYGVQFQAVLAGYLESDPITYQFAEIQWDWVGKAGALAELARHKADMLIPERRMHPDDFDHGIVAEMYKRFYQWYESGKPAWKDKIFRLRSKT